MSLEQDLIADAVNLLANSGTGHGHRGRFTGEYMAGITYAATRELAHGLLQNQIGFSNTPGEYARTNAVGVYLSNFYSSWHGSLQVTLTRVSSRILDSLRTGVNYEYWIAVLSDVLLHEAVHRMLHDTLDSLEEEVLCYIAEGVYIDELQGGGVRLDSIVLNRRISASLSLGLDPSFIRHQRSYLSLNLIDNVVDDYPHYAERTSAAYVRKVFDYWNGIGNRRARTKGYFLKALASDYTNAANAEFALRILESVGRASRSDWDLMKRTSQNFLNLARLFERLLPNSPLRQRADAVASMWGESFNRPFIGHH